MSPVLLRKSHARGSGAHFLAWSGSGTIVGRATGLDFKAVYLLPAMAVRPGPTGCRICRVRASLPVANG